MKVGLLHKLSHALERYLPEQRLFLRSDSETRFIRLTAMTQAGILFGGALVTGWTILATSILLIDSFTSGNAREQAAREQRLYEARINALSAERDERATEAANAQQRFNLALSEVSKMQSRLLASEDRRKELETGIEVIQTTLRRTMKERDASIQRFTEIQAELAATTGSANSTADMKRTAEGSVDFLAQALTETAAQRDQLRDEAALANEQVAELRYRAKLEREKTNRVFSQLEDAVTISVKPLDDMFKAVGMPTDRILETVRRGYTGQGGPLEPIAVSTKGGKPDPSAMRANALIDELAKVNLYRMAVEKVPFAFPLKTSSYRLSSGFGYRRDPFGGGTRMHSGQDIAGASGTPIYATADGVVSHADWSSGYGRLIKIKHEFGVETRYAHLLKIRVKKGQRVSKGERIGDMGSSGRSTGTHLHYEIRQGAKPVNPMTYIKAARNVF
ncbi:MAG: DUF5930 domain-containing protein [Brevirhabdus sp.]